MKDRVDAVFGKDELPVPKPLFGFTLRGAHEKTEAQLRHMIATDRRIQFPLDDFETSLYNAVQVHCAITGKVVRNYTKEQWKDIEYFTTKTLDE